MILINELKGMMKARCLTQADMAKKIGISTKTFNSKLNKGVFNSNEISVLIDILDIKNPNEIFFAKKVTQ
ncbi:helix-turn-helix domain-containing protein [Vallitalea sp.]|jgi:DNA-binding XRE family transcriptional regulator|uniref:helix-turn-helix domain-containing protein n=1 Tax=Vallitalea sp. TaxID=1882829 RepID=UPI0025CDF084|nr:helix-turn-helix domain-containing protein [Vallitalea sp.]MCT4686602.1 DUF739 domain-containing protein [Vallitalea sp.]